MLRNNQTKLIIVAPPASTACLLQFFCSRVVGDWNYLKLLSDGYSCSRTRATLNIYIYISKSAKSKVRSWLVSHVRVHFVVTS